MKAEILKSHRSAYPNPIAFKQGDRIKVGAEDAEYPGWVWAETSDKNMGWAPSIFMKYKAPELAVAKEDYSAKELEVDVGEQVEVLRQIHGWSLCINFSGECGWVPTAVLKHA